MSSSEHVKALAVADQKLTLNQQTNVQLINAASSLLKAGGDPAHAWATLGARLMRDFKIGPGDPGEPAVELLAALYIECAQTRTESEEDQ